MGVMIGKNNIFNTGISVPGGNVIIGTTVANASPQYVRINNWSTAAAGSALIIGGWQGSQFWGIGTDSSTGDLYVKIGVSDNVGTWQATNANLIVGGKINAGGDVNVGGNVNISSGTGAFITTGTGNYVVVRAVNDKVYLQAASGSAVYCTQPSAPTSYVPINASAFTVNSDAAAKKNITPYPDGALNEVTTTTVYQYNYNWELDGEHKHTGLIMQYAPADVVDPSGVGVDIYAVTGVLWKAVQELTDRVKALEAKVNPPS